MGTSKSVFGTEDKDDETDEEEEEESVVPVIG